MSLLEFQSALGKAVRSYAADNSTAASDFAGERFEHDNLPKIVRSAGFRFTVAVQRSWSMARASKGARLTLSLLPREHQTRLLNDWIARGGGTGSFYTAEAEAFLDFIAQSLPCPSQVLTVCNLERATIRASEGARHFVIPDLLELDHPECVLTAGLHASLVELGDPPRSLLAPLPEKTVSPSSEQKCWVLFAPNLKELFREATQEEVKLWHRIKEPIHLVTILGEGYPRNLVESFILDGAASFR